MRFLAKQAPETRLVSSSAKKDAQLLIYTENDIYYLVPLVMIGDKWFITNPKIAPHEMA